MSDGSGNIVQREPRPDQRLVAALGYLVTPVVPLMVRSKAGDDPFLMHHARQGLIWAVPFLLLLVIVTVGMIALIRSETLFICLLPFALLLPFAPGGYWAMRVYTGREVRFPFGSDSDAR